MSFREDKDLIEACKRGDSSAFRKIYEAYKDKVHSLGYYMTGDREAAKDITQQVFLKVFTSILTFQYRASFSSWLFRLAVNVCRDYQRSIRKMRLFSADAPVSLATLDSGLSLDENLFKERVAQTVQKVVMKMSPKLRTVIILKYIEDLSYSQIAELLGCSIGTVSSRLNRSHKILAEGHSHNGKVEHYCRTNVAYKVNKGRYGSETLDGVKFWLAADVGSDFSAGQTEWAVLYFDSSLNRKQREAVWVILSNLMPVKWKSFQTAEAKIDRWEFNNESAYASLDAGNTAVIRLKRFQGMSNEPVVIRNLGYWGAPRNDGFQLMQNEFQAYRVGPKAFEFKGTAGLLITFDMNSNDPATRKKQAKWNSEKGIRTFY